MSKKTILFQSTKKHDELISHPSIFKLAHGAKICAKTLMFIHAGIQNCCRYHNYLFLISRVTMGELILAIEPIINDNIRFKFPDFWADSVESHNKTLHIWTFFNNSRMRLLEINERADKNLSRIKGSFPYSAILLDESSAFSDRVYEPLIGNSDKHESYDEVALHQFLFDNKIIKINRLKDNKSARRVGSLF